MRVNQRSHRQNNKEKDSQLVNTVRTCMDAEELTGVIGIGVHVTNLQGKRSRNQRRKKKKKARDVLEKVKGRTVGGCLSRVEANFSL